MTDQNKPPHSLRIGEADIAPGTRITLQLPVTDLSTHTPMTMPVQVIRGEKDGPRLFVSAAIHGDEINGVEIVGRLLASDALKNIVGTLIAVPVVNVFGFVAQSRYLPDRRDLNRCFPGSAAGSLAGRLANLFLREIVDNATHGIDLHTGAIHRSNYPQIRANLSDPGVDGFARSFGAPVLIDSGMREGSLRESAAKRGVPVLVYEAGEALRFDEQSISEGLAGVLRAMTNLGMLRGQEAEASAREPFVAHSSAWVRAPRSGVLRESVALGAAVKKGNVLGVVTDSFAEGRVEVRAKTDGVVIGCTFLPIVYEGDALFHIVSGGGAQVSAADLDLPALDAAYQEAEEDLRDEDDALTYG